MAISAPPEPSSPGSTRSLDGLTDSELVAEVRRGGDRAFEHLYGRYHRRIAAYVYGMVNDYGRAEDIAQDVFMSALRRMRDTDRPIAFKPWIYEIAKNACIDEFRRARRTEEVSYDADDGMKAEDYGRLVTPGPAPDAAVEQKMAIDHLCGAFGGLSETHHQILVMREFEGLSYRAIGERLGMSRASVESTLFRARRRLGEEYQELVSGERCQRVRGIIAAAEAALPGARDQRRLAAHLSHCQACRRHAKLAGLDATLVVVPRGARAKIAAFFPLPLFLRKRWFGEDALPAAANRHVSTLAQYSAQVGTSLDPTVASWARAAAAAATLAAAGIAGGSAVTDDGRSFFRDTGPASAPIEAVVPPAAVPAAAAPAVASAPARSSAPQNRPAATTGKVAPAGARPSGSPGTASASKVIVPAAPEVPAAPAVTLAGVDSALERARTATGGGPVAGDGAPAVPAVPVVPAPDAVDGAITAAGEAVQGQAKTQAEDAARAAQEAAAAAAAAVEAASRDLIGG